MCKLAFAYVRIASGNLSAYVCYVQNKGYLLAYLLT